MRSAAARKPGKHRWERVRTVAGHLLVQCKHCSQVRGERHDPVCQPASPEVLATPRRRRGVVL